MNVALTEGGSQDVETKNILIATGSEVTPLPWLLAIFDLTILALALAPALAPALALTEPLTPTRIR